MANGTKFPEQNQAWTCEHIPGCVTLYTHDRPEPGLGMQFIGCHELSGAERAEVAETGRVFVGIFGGQPQPIHVYGGKFPFPSDSRVTPESVGSATRITDVLRGCASPAEFVELWHWLHPSVRNTRPVLACYIEAESKWPGKLYPSYALKFEMGYATTYADRLRALGWLDPVAEQPANWWESDTELTIEVQILRSGEQHPTTGYFSANEGGKWFTIEATDRRGEQTVYTEVEVTDIVGWQYMAQVPEPDEVQPEPEA